MKKETMINQASECFIHFTWFLNKYTLHLNKKKYYSNRLNNIIKYIRTIYLKK